MNLNLKKGLEITINEDPNRVVCFDPEDTAFAENFYALTRKLSEKQKEFDEKVKALETDERDEYGIQKTLPEQIALQKDICAFFYAEIDALFGEGTSKTAFGNSNSFDLIAQFFNGLSPLIKKTREEKVLKYVGNRTQRRSAGLK